MRRVILNTIALAGLSSFIVGCAVNETATVTVNDDGTTQIIESNSGLLSDSLSIVDTKTAFVGNLLKAQASIKNDSGSQLNFQYKFKWLDKNGFEVAIDGRPWQPLSITPHESKTVQGVAPNPTVNSFKILVQD
ncbi:YcfL family protein [Alkalimarinus sediminis]|uniref:YcfL family protein n=1 Tax=Alkalimarinus sediminis TaxID=1632866 RepID=A0A9E8HIH8_9ALTE|nr:YcfL family protein [Alkalimarinus sediminis]UZW73962.1 YcfL family protein [Alkalimarinus sediminis]